MLYKLQEAIIKWFDEYSLLVSDAKYKAFQGQRIKILTSKQMLQRLPIALAQLKAGNTSESLLNEIRYIACSLHWIKEITRKVQTNIIKSIQI